MYHYFMKIKRGWTIVDPSPKIFVVCCLAGLHLGDREDAEQGAPLGLGRGISLQLAHNAALGIDDDVVVVATVRVGDEVGPDVDGCDIDIQAGADFVQSLASDTHANRGHTNLGADVAEGHNVPLMG